MTVQTRMPTALARQLQRDAGLGLQDYDVLVQLTDTPSARLRLSELADLLQWDRSRMSHHITRMAARGLVTREQCPDDRRGAFVVLTSQGRATIEAAAPHHVEGVRELLFDHLDEDDLAALDRITGGILQRLDQA